MASGTARGGFRCEALVDQDTWSETRARLQALVRTYGELLAVYSFMHLAFKEKSMCLLAGDLANRATEIKRAVQHAFAVSPGLAIHGHALAHLKKADYLLIEAEKHLQRGRLVSNSALLGLLSNAANELKRSAHTLGTTTFDTTACCGGFQFGHGEENHGSTFDLGS